MDAHEWVSLGTLAAALASVGVQFVRAWWERRARAASEAQNRDAQERELLFQLHAALEELRRRALDVLRMSPVPRKAENALESAIRQADFRAEQLAHSGIRDAAARAVLKCREVHDRWSGSYEKLDSHRRPKEMVEADSRFEAVVEGGLEEAMALIKGRLRDLDPSTPPRESVGA